MKRDEVFAKIQEQVDIGLGRNEQFTSTPYLTLVRIDNILKSGREQG